MFGLEDVGDPLDGLWGTRVATTREDTVTQTFVAPIYIASLGVKALLVGLERGEFMEAGGMVKVKMLR